MVNRLDDTDRDLLNFRPDIDYIEPDVEPGVITPISEDLPQLEDVLAKRRKVMKLARSVDILATFMQARADEKAEDMVINLDPKVDAAVIQSMARRFPGANPNRITYPQYRACKDAMREAGQNIADKANIKPDQIDALRDDASNMLGGSDETGDGPRREPKGVGAGLRIGGFNTDWARTGGLRPELNPDMQVIEPLDLEEIQFSLICILVNYIWENFILKAFDFKILGKSIADLLPQKLCESRDIEIPNLILLGKEIPEFFKQLPPKLSDIAPEIKK